MIKIAVASERNGTEHFGREEFMIFDVEDSKC